MMEFTKKALITAAIIFVFFAALGQFGLRTGQVTTLTPLPTLVPVTPVPTITTNADDPIKDAFIKGCTKDGTTLAFCNCGYSYIIRTIGVEGMIKLGLRLNDKTTTKEDTDLINDAAISCSELYRN